MKKVVLIGIDGASWTVIDSLLKDNKLPTLKRLINNGMRKILYNINTINIDSWHKFYIYREQQKKIPPLGIHPDVADWTTLATGVMPERHGLITSTEEDIRRRERPSSRKQRKKPTIWEIIARHNKKVGIIGWIANWPPLPLKNYIITRISDVFLPSFERGIETTSEASLFNNGRFRCAPAYPSWLWGKLKRIHYDREINKFVQKVNFAAHRRELIYDSLYLGWAKYFLKKFPQPDFLAICLYGVHTLSHLFWDCLKVERCNFKGIIHQGRRIKFGYIIEDYYEYIDKRLGELLQYVDNKSIIMVVSAYGMRKSRVTKKYLLMDEIYKELGFLKFKNDKIDWKTAQVYDNQNPWGIFAARKGFIKSKHPEKTFRYLKNSMAKIETERGEPLFLKINFNERDDSFMAVINYKAIHYSTRIFLNHKVFPIKKLVNFIPHYSLHNPEGIIICSNDNHHFNINKSRITTLDIAPIVFDLLGVRDKDTDRR